MQRRKRLDAAVMLSSAWLAVMPGLTDATVLSPNHARARDPASPPRELGFSIANMDRSVDPRRDFYRYANGRWLARTPIPASDPQVGGFSQLGHQLDARLATLIREAARSGAAPGTPRQQVGDFHRAAMDLGRQDALGLRPIQPDLSSLDSMALDNPVALGRLSARLQLAYGGSPIANASPGIDFKDSTALLLELLPGIQALNRDEYLKAEAAPVRELYLDFITRMFRALGDEPRQAWEHARTVLAMETELAAARITPIQARDPAALYNRMSLDEAQALVPAVDLKAFIAALGMAPPAVVIVPDLGGFKAVGTVWQSRSVEDRRTLLRWHLVSSRASALGRPFRDLDQTFSLRRQGIRQAEPRERAVTRLIATSLYHPLSRLYVERYFSEETRREVTEMVGLIRAEFADRLRSNTWLDDATRTAALDKLAKIEIEVGYPKQWIDFSSVAIRPDDHFGNLQRLGEFDWRRSFDRLGKPVVRERFAAPGETTPISVNAAYNPQQNGIDITAAIVQPPFFKPGADPAVNYCTMGAVIGHEITHGFDSFGRQFGPAGNLRDWWTPAATAAFKQRTDVLVEQYGSYEILPGLMHNGAQTVTENTADLGGITLAHAALRRRLAGKPQPAIDGLTPDQRCFVAWAQLWAYKARPERLRTLVSIDFHSISSLRGTAPLMHLDAFHEAFRTRPGDPMWRAPEKRVRIW